MVLQKLLALVLVCVTSAIPSTIYTSADVPKTSAPFTLTSTIDVPDNFLLTDVNVTLNMDVFFAEDVEIFLTSPAATQVQLFNRNCGLGDPIAMTFDDQAALGLGSCGSFDAGSGLAFQPFEALSAFGGEQSFGVWTLTAVDIYATFSGDLTLRSWSLELSGPSEAPIPEPATFSAAALGLLGLAAYGYRRRRRSGN